MSLTESLFSHLPPSALENLRQADRSWSALRTTSQITSSPVVQTASTPLPQTPDWDVVICGATLGVVLGTALVQRGWRVALLERGILRGRQQEWNISRSELEILLHLDLLSEAELERTIATEYNPGRIAFLGGPEIWLRDVLNIGVDPVYLLECLKQRFLTQGGYLLEQTAFEGAIVHTNGVSIHLGGGNISQPPLQTRLLLDMMGHFSPIATQARQGQKPDGICLVVGSCAQGFQNNDRGDLLVSFTPIHNQCQYFWEAFPARDGRTTYLFTYLDAHPDRPSLETLFEDYCTWLPTYQQVDWQGLRFQRALFGVLPSYRTSPLQPSWDRILQVGDSSGNQSPLSFGGFGALLRHLGRLDQGIHEALSADCLDRSALKLLQPYQPNLAVTWLFQRSMSVAVGQTLDPNQINHLLAKVFAVMERSGEAVLKPFMQDVIQFPALAYTLLQMGLRSPLIIPQILPQVGLGTLVRWFGHYVNLGTYAALAPLAQVLAPWSAQWSPRQTYLYHRWLEALQYGSGQDYGQFESREEEISEANP